MPFGPGNPLIEVFLLKCRNQIAILCMHHRQGPQFGTPLEGREHFVVFHHQGTFVSHEVLERIHSHLNGIFHLVENVLVPARDRHMIADIGTNLRG